MKKAISFLTASLVVSLATSAFAQSTVSDVNSKITSTTLTSKQLPPMVTDHRIIAEKKVAVTEARQDKKAAALERKNAIMERKADAKKVAEDRKAAREAKIANAKQMAEERKAAREQKIADARKAAEERKAAREEKISDARHDRAKDFAMNFRSEHPKIAHDIITHRSFLEAHGISPVNAMRNPQMLKDRLMARHGK